MGPGSVWPGTRGVCWQRGAFGWGRAPESWAARREKTDVLSSEDDAPDSPVILEAPSLPPLPPAYPPAYKKSLRLSSDQIVRVRVDVWVCRRGWGRVVITLSPSPTRPGEGMAPQSHTFTKAQDPSPLATSVTAPA